MKKRNSIFSGIIFCLALVAVLLFISTGHILFGQSRHITNKDNSLLLYTGWYLWDTDTVFDPVNPIYPVDEQNCLRISRTLTSSNTLYTLSYKTSFQLTRVYCNDTRVYSYGNYNDEYRDSLLGKVWHFIDLRGMSAGDELTVEIIQPDGKTVDVTFLDSLRIGDKSDIQHGIITDRLLPILVSTILIAISLVFIMISVIQSFARLQVDTTSLSYLSIFMLFASIWVLTDAGILQFILPRSSAITLLSFSTMILMPLPLIMFFNSLCDSRAANITLNILSLLNLILYAAFIALFALKVAELTQMMFVSHIFAALTLLLLAFIAVTDRTNNKRVRSVYLGILLFFVFCVFALFEYYVMDSASYISVFVCGLLVLGLIMYGTAMLSLFDLLKESLNSSVYKRLALLDSQTGLNGRLAYNAYAIEYETKKAELQSVACFMFDLNNLKITNDKLGHLEGDKLIEATAHCLNAAFSDVSAYPSAESHIFRVGGDEFVVVLENITPENTEELIALFHKSVNDYNSACSIMLDVAFGCVYSDTPANTPFHDISRSADRKMYFNKSELKEVVSNE